MLILSIDPGFEKLGYAIFEKEKSSFKYLSSGLIKTTKELFLEERLKYIYQKLYKIINHHAPDLITLEQIFFFKNQKTVVKVSQVQGVILLLAAQKNIPTCFLTPLQIKQIVTGYGRSDKKAIYKMLKIILKDSHLTNQDDELDAIACGLAYCYLNRNI